MQSNQTTCYLNDKKSRMRDADNASNYPQSAVTWRAFHGDKCATRGDRALCTLQSQWLRVITDNAAGLKVTDKRFYLHT